MINLLLENYQSSCASFKFESSRDDELDLLPNQVLVSSIDNHGGWGYGFSKGKTGWFPVNYVEKIDKNFYSKRNYLPEVVCFDRDSYKSSITNLIENEHDYVKDLKQKYGSICSDFCSKTLTVKFDSSSILRLCEDFIQKYDGFISILEKESKKSTERQKIGNIYKKFNTQIFNSILSYCQLHSFFIHSIITYKNDIEKAKQNNEIQNNFIAIIQFYSSIFLRINDISGFLEHLLDQIQNTSKEYVCLQRAICQFNFLYNYAEEVRTSYSFLAQLIPLITPLVSNAHVLNKNLLHSTNVTPTSIPLEQLDSKQYFLIFHTEKLFFGYSEIFDDPTTFKITDVFPLESTYLKLIENKEDFCNLISVESTESDRKLELVTPGSHEQKFILSLFDKIKKGERYLPRWIDINGVPLTVPSIPIKITKHRLTRGISQLERSEDISVDYKLLSSILNYSLSSSPGNHCKHEQNKEEASQTSNQMILRMNKIEERINDLTRKLDHYMMRSNTIEEVVMTLIRHRK